MVHLYYYYWFKNSRQMIPPNPTHTHAHQPTHPPHIFIQPNLALLAKTLDTPGVDNFHHFISYARMKIKFIHRTTKIKDKNVGVKTGIKIFEHAGKIVWQSKIVLEVTEIKQLTSILDYFSLCLYKASTTFFKTCT